MARRRNFSWYLLIIAAAALLAATLTWHFTAQHPGPAATSSRHDGLSEIQRQELEERQALEKNLKEAEKEVPAERLLELTRDRAALEEGKQVYMARCQPCHGTNGEGGSIGSNLTDDYWIYGGSITDIRKSTAHGIVEKAMPNWGLTLSGDDINNVVAYVWSLRGSNPPNAKPPQGNHVPR